MVQTNKQKITLTRMVSTKVRRKTVVVAAECCLHRGKSLCVYSFGNYMSYRSKLNLFVQQMADLAAKPLENNDRASGKQLCSSPCKH